MFLAFEIISILCLLLSSILLYIKRSHNYWSRLNVPTTARFHPILGNAENPLSPKRGLGRQIEDCYDEFRRRKEKHGGIYLLAQPIYMPIDPELIKNILIKDFPHFPGHGIRFNEKVNPLSLNLFGLEGEKWKRMRVKLTPTFTSGKMKGMFKTMLDCGVPMIGYVDKLACNGETLDIKEILSCYTTDIIGSCAFGLDCNSFKDPNAAFRTYGRKHVTPSFRTLFFQLSSFILPDEITCLLPVKLMRGDVENFVITTVKDILEYRTINNIDRNDFIKIFMEMQEKAKAVGTETMTLEEISAQAFIFFVAGFETSSTTMAFCLHELAFNQDIQDKLREEIRETYKKNDGELAYDAVIEMKYLDQVINETLRKYPPVSTLNRVCSADYNVPDTDLTLRAGTKVFISTLGLHRDPEYYPEPERFDPERFSEENRSRRPQCSFVPFGEGPRICIGLRFGTMQTKIGLSMLLNDYKIFPAKGERYSIEFDPRSFILTKKGKIMLRAEKIGC